MLVAPKLRICRPESIPRQPHCCVRPFTRQDLRLVLTPGPIQNISDVAQGPAVRSVIPWVRFVGTKRGEARPHVRHETAPLHHVARRRGRVAARGAGAAASDAGGGVPPPSIGSCGRGSVARIPPRLEGGGLCRWRERGDRISL